MVLGHFVSGRNLMVLGRFASSRSHLEQALALYDPVSHASLVQKTGVNPGLGSQAFLGIVLFCLGHPDQGLAQSNAAVAEARGLAHLPSLAGMLSIGATLVGVDAVFGQWVDELVAIATEQGFPYWRAQGTILRGWLAVENGDVPEGIFRLRSCLAAYRAIGTQNWMAYYVALLASACKIAGHIEEAMALLDESLRIVETTGECWFAAELNRLKGYLMLSQGRSDAAEELYRKALGIAREQEAKLWELRTAASFARLRLDQGRRTEARDLLAPVYGWFTEGFNTQDLKEAKALLDELGGA